MEVDIVRLYGFLVAAVLAGALYGEPSADVSDLDDLSAYYGFETMEIVKLDWGIKDLRIADLNGDGRNDIVIANNLKAKIELLIQRETPGPEEAEAVVDPNDTDINALVGDTRFERQSIPVSESIHSLVCGDLNSDGLADLAFYGEPKGLYVIVQKPDKAGGGTSKSLSWRTKRKIQIDDGLPASDMLVCGDLNKDGANDLALAAKDGIYILLQHEGALPAEPVKYPTSARTLRVAIGDLNGDRANDLILLTDDGDQPVHVRFGLETGRLGPQVSFSIERPSAFQLFDLDEDGGDEVLTVEGRSGRLIGYKLGEADREESDWPALFYPLPAGEGKTKRDLVAADFDGDGLADVVISDPGAAELVFYRQSAGLGLAEPVTFPAFSDITSLSGADLDGDGKSELGVLSVKEKVIGISRFEDERLSFPVPLDVNGEPLAMELADVDGQGGPDCVYVAKDKDNIRTLRVIYNVGGADANEGEPPANAEKSTATELKKLAANPDALRVLDVDQDGLADVLIFVQYELPLLVRQVEKGKFEPVDSVDAQSSLIQAASLRSTACADVDGKPGKELLVAQSNFARSLVFSEGRKWRVLDQYNARSKESRVSAVGVFDLYGDGAAERSAIVLLDSQKGRLQILRAGQDNTYRFAKELRVGAFDEVPHLKLLFAPLTGRKAGSILLFDGAKFALVTPPGKGTGPQRLEEQFSYETKIKDGRYGNLVPGDINSDDRTDIIMVEYKRNHLEILALDGGSRPVPAMRFKIFEQKSYRETGTSVKAGVEPRELRVADVTGDGKADLVTVIHDRIIVYPQD